MAEPFTPQRAPRTCSRSTSSPNFNLDGGAEPGSLPVGAARIIDIDDPRHPKVVSDIRLAGAPARRAQRRPAERPGRQLLPVQGYAGHYCSLPTRKDPKLVACSMILSGLRVFDISDVRRPEEVGYFNRPLRAGHEADEPRGAGRLRDVAAGLGRRAPVRSGTPTATAASTS